MTQCIHTTFITYFAGPPAIVTGFIPPLNFIRNSSERLIATTSGDSNNNLVFNPRRILVEGPPSIELVDDGTVIIRTLHIGCKGEGLPKSDITWYQVDGRMSITGDTSLTRADRTQLLDGSQVVSTGDFVTITVPRGGRSVLTVELNPTESICRRYICEANTQFATPSTALGGVDICPECTYVHVCVVCSFSN